MNRIRGRTALVTGATAGIGEATAKALAEQGVGLILVARRKERLDDVERAIRAEHEVDVRTHVSDVRDRDGVLAFARELEDDDVVPEILVNNAGLGRGLSPVQEGRFEDWDDMIETNITGLLNVTRAILPLMVERDRGHVVNLGSIAGRVVYPGGNVYNATKFAVRALNRAMNIDLVGTNIRVSTVDPGAVETEFSVVRFRGDEERAANVYRGYRPLTPEDVADAIRYVLNAPDHVNVQELVIMPTDQRSPYVHHKEEG